MNLCKELKMTLSVFTASVMLVLLLPIGLSATALPGLFGVENSYLNTYEDFDVEFYDVGNGSSDVPSLGDTTFDSRYCAWDQEWYNKTYAPIKNQRPTGTCWVFAPTTVAELSWEKECYEKKITRKMNVLSPIQLGYFTFNRTNDPLNNTAGDYNNNATVTEENKWYSIGGNYYLATQTMANWSALCT